eukprot:s351_g10.t1
MGSGASHSRGRLDRLELHQLTSTESGESGELFDRVGAEAFGAERSRSFEALKQRPTLKPWIYTRVKAYNAEEWAARFGVPGEAKEETDGSEAATDDRSETVESEA